MAANKTPTTVGFIGWGLANQAILRALQASATPTRWLNLFISPNG